MSPSEVLPVYLDTVAEKLAIPLDPSTIRYVSEPPAYAFGIQDVDRQYDIYMTTQQASLSSVERPLYDAVPYRKNLWRGLLRYQMGNFVVRGNPGRGLNITTTLTTSPDGINQAQMNLGRRPGIDAFQLSRHKNANILTAGDWIRGFSDLTIPVADLNNIQTAQHDTHVGDHVLSWIMTPPVICKRIGKVARGLYQEYGAQIDLWESERPQVATAFVAALDDLADFTKELFNALNFADNDNNYYPAYPKTIAHYIRRAPNLLPLGQRELFSSLGVMPHNRYRWQYSKDAQLVTTAFIAHTARLFLKLEDIKPLANEKPLDRDKRIKSWREVAQKYADAEIALAA